MLKYRLSFDDMWKKPIKSKAKFSGKYKDELEILMDETQEALENASCERFEVESVLPSGNKLRARINDPELGGQIIVNCVFWYHHSDERYGYVNVDLVTSWLSKKSETRLVGKFPITERETVRAEILRNLAVCVKF